jgi:hypothetical protein
VAVETTTPRSRRHILAAGLGALGAVIAAAIGRPSAARAVDGAPVLIGTANSGTLPTTLDNTTAGSTSFKATQVTGTALRGESTGDTASTFPDGSYRSGVVASVGDLGTPGDPGAVAPNSDEIGVYGYANVSENSAGVWGDTWDGAGVLGTGTYGVLGIGESYGLYGTTAAPNAGYALYTNGPIIFYGRSGRSYVRGGTSFREVAIAGMKSTSAVIATLQTNRAGFYVQSVVSSPGKFRLNLNRVAPGPTFFSYLVID